MSEMTAKQMKRRAEQKEAEALDELIGNLAGCLFDMIGDVVDSCLAKGEEKREESRRSFLESARIANTAIADYERSVGR